MIDTSVILDKYDLMKTFQYMDTVLKKSWFNYAAKDGLLRLSVVAIPRLEQFGIYRGASTYDELPNNSTEYGINLSANIDASLSKSAWVGSSSTQPKLTHPIEDKLNGLAYQLAEISLTVRKYTVAVTDHETLKPRSSNTYPVLNSLIHG